MNRIINLILAILLILIMLIPMALISILIFVFIDRKVLFTQIRIGKDENPFTIYKFKTMKDLYDTKGVLIEDEKRIPSFGNFLRSMSLDELPEILNIFKGNMSFVGPRPLLPEYLPFYTESERKRHFVLPGITGLAQINGRNAIAWEDKFKFDLFYVENKSFFLDLEIIYRTFKIVFKRQGISTGDSTIMPRLDKIRKIEKKK